jgi:hypothetical protein
MDVLEDVFDFLTIEAQLRLRQASRVACWKSSRLTSELQINFVLLQLRDSAEFVVAPPVEWRYTPWHSGVYGDACHGYCAHVRRVLSRVDHSGALLRDVLGQLPAHRAALAWPRSCFLVQLLEDQCRIHGGATVVPYPAAPCLGAPAWRHIAEHHASESFVGICRGGTTPVVWASNFVPSHYAALSIVQSARGVDKSVGITYIQRALTHFVVATSQGPPNRDDVTPSQPTDESISQEVDSNTAMKRVSRFLANHPHTG